MSVTIWSAYHLDPPGHCPLHDQCAAKWDEQAAKFFCGFEQTHDWAYCAIYRASGPPLNPEVTENEKGVTYA